MDTLTALSTSPEAAAGAGLLLGLGAGYIAFISIFSLIMYILLIIAWWKIFVKAGEKGWKSLIPLYNSYLLFKIFWNTKKFWTLICVVFLGSLLSGLLLGVADGLVSSLISLACAIYALVIGIKLNSRKSKSFGHGVGFTLGLIFLPNIFALILGFNKDTYRKLAD